MTWLEVQAEMDYIAWRLSDMHIDVSHRSRLDRMIDEATGREAAMTTEADDLIARWRELLSLLEEAAS